MQLLTVAVAFLLAHTVQGKCSSLEGSRGVTSMDPRHLSYDTDAVATITCVDQYFVSWAADVNQITGAVKCDGNGKWYTPDDTNIAAGDVYCFACTDSISCTEGTCTSGECDCNPGFKKVGDVRVCEAITCAAPTLTSATADPVQTTYNVDVVVKVTCDDGYHIQGEDDAVIERDITCKDDGFFTPLAPICIVCDDDTDCTEAVCRSGTCQCNAGFKFAAGSLRVCEKVACTDDYCKNYGVCSVQGSELSCECPKGTTGTTCETFPDKLDPCKSNPCLNEGVCSRDVETDKTDLTKHTCQCTDAFEEGGNCEYAKAFHISTSDPGGVLKSDITAVEFGVTMATTLPDMYIALLQVKDAKNALYKVVLKNVGDGASIAISITEGVGQFGTKHAATIGNIDLSSGENKIKIFIDGTTSFLKVVINNNANDEYDSELAFRFITEVRLGGNLGNCKWDDTSCSIGSSRVKYVPFVGTFYGVTINDVKQPFASISTSSNDKAVAKAMDCTTFTCENKGQCTDTAGIISCTTCPTGFTGFNCDKYSGVSFNGYTSSYASQADISVPLSVTEQSLLIEFDKSAEEVGEIAKLTLGGCTLAIHATGGDKYRLQDQPVDAAGSSLTVTFDGATAKIGGVSAPCTWDFIPISSVVSVVLGGSDPAPDSDVTKAAARYQGCIKKVSVNGVDLLVKSDDATLTNVDTKKCVTDNLPPDPCTTGSNPCKNEMPCTTKADDYSASCTCKVPYIKDALCNLKNYCDGGHACAINGDCKKFDTMDDCKETLGANKCGKTDRWYYYCKCKEGWQGDNCSVEEDKEEPVKSDGNSTTIIVVIVVVAVVIGVVAVVIIVKKRKNVPAANGASNGKSKGTYSPQAQEKDLELAGKTEEAPAKNIYDDPEVIKNPNAESPVVAEASAPEPGPAQEKPAPPADTTVTIEPEGDTGSRGPEGPPPDPI